MIKRIFAMVSEEDFYRFRKRCYSEHHTFRSAFTALVIGYIRGEINIGESEKAKVYKVTVNKYLEDHKQIEEGGK